jgi:hypothetical protein
MNYPVRLIILLLLLPFLTPAQPVKKSIPAHYSQGTIKIDGSIDEPAWKDALPAGNFVQQSPYNGPPAMLPSEVRIAYDQSGIYIGAMMHDPHPDSIPKQLGLRDANNLNADYFTVILCPFRDGINAFCFKVYVSDVQEDYKLPGGFGSDGDISWDAVWYSKARIRPDGWVAELFIPYSAFRFPKADSGSWDINFIRSIRRYRELDSWNFIDAKVDGTVNQSGLLTGLRDIKPPLRLSVTPYVSAYVEKNPSNPDWLFSYNAGADLKYGIDQSFTLDMTLIPDFGQVASDDKIYNLTPYEIRYDEKRQFFTEGTELFNKSGLFYSRRVGTTPKKYDDACNLVDTGEKVTENPSQTRLINAAKVSGRTNKGLGIGVFNAMSSNTWATIFDTVTGENRRVMTQGFTNYNMIVFDQALKNNSYFDVLNTNYYMPTEGYTANVSGVDMKFANHKYTNAFYGSLFVSQKYYSHASPVFGYHYSFSAGKISGNFTWNYSQLLETDTYDPNDLGFNEVNNRFDHRAYFQYNIYEPFGKFLAWYNSGWISYKMLYKDFKYTSFGFGAESHGRTDKHLDFDLNAEIYPIESHDYYEPRVKGWMYISPATYNLSSWISTDYRKPVALDFYAAGAIVGSRAATGWYLEVDPRFRITDRILIVYALSAQYLFNLNGYVKDSLDASGNTVILFGRRDTKTLTQILTASYMIRSDISVNLRVRHYWLRVPYYSFWQLQPDGHLIPSDYTGNEDIDANLFNIDFGFTWNFAPGSQLSVVWKNAISNIDNTIPPDYLTNMHETLTTPATNSFSVRMIYYLDALYLKKKKKSGLN